MENFFIFLSYLWFIPVAVIIFIVWIISSITDKIRTKKQEKKVVVGQGKANPQIAISGTCAHCGAPLKEPVCKYCNCIN